MNNSGGITPEKAVFSLFSGENGDNPFPLFAQLRGMGSVIPVPFPIGGTDYPAWMVTRIEEAMLVLKDHHHFTVDSSSIAGTSRSMLSLSSYSDSDSPTTFFTGKSMLSVDEPDHRRLRRLVSKAFTPRFIESLRPRVQEIADELLDQVLAAGEMDLVKDYAYPLPINVISEMLGVPKEDREQIQTWSAALAHGLGLGRREPGVDEHMRAFGDYTARLVGKKRELPGDDLISQLIAIEEGEDQLDEAELVSMITLLIFAGHETTSNLIATGSLMLLDHPEQLKKLKADLSLVPLAVEELLRFNGPATIAGPRFATEDIELAGQQIKRGDAVIVVLKSANRDEIQFAEPEELDITRTINRHLAFGHGIHMCLGAPLARMEGEIAFTSLLTRMPGLRLNIPREKVVWSFTLSSQGLTTLPVAF
ncbi:cytochrome P450 family protein [Paenibacillus woosongensis]|uniref:Polyketide biosynthesis cytochrome P450 PksS n=1 Tax=Paenibacillus woosongensis TaxID=307580 RepID=A0ABQ4MK12_9BACL|nr:cytochrome P450 [Paenibacillus woosongensis]GIP56259.1 polyketide biosynthesis cytochrome P450 PksS [Paenibacillus woosongensis]